MFRNEDSGELLAKEYSGNSGTNAPRSIFPEISFFQAMFVLATPAVTSNG